MANFSIRTKTDPDNQAHDTAYDRTIAIFKRISDPMLAAAGIEDNDHELAEVTMQRAAFDTAMELGVQLDVEPLATGGLQFTFDFVGSIVITEVDPDEAHPLQGADFLGRNPDKPGGAVTSGWLSDTEINRVVGYDPAAEIAAAVNPEEDWDLDAFEEDDEPPKLTPLNRGGGLWALCLDGRVVLDDESYAVVHGIIENADVGELREIRDSLTAGV